MNSHTDIVLGVHLLGADSAELIQLMGVIVIVKLTKKQLDDTIAVHPTLAEKHVTIRTLSYRTVHADRLAHIDAVSIL